MSRWFVRGVGLLIAMAFCVTYTSGQVYAAQQSSNFRFDESSLDAGGLIQSNSTNFQSSSSAGDTGVGNSASASFQVDAGSQTTDDPALSFAITNADANFGSFSASGPATTTATFTITNYTSYGYVVQIAGNAPSNGAHTIAAMSTTAPSQFGIEQFGINLVENALPLAFGADPDHGYFASGSAAPNYDTPDEYRYVSGETIALASESSGMTTYTISYLVNVSSLTPGGQYTSDQTIIVTGTY